ncbi:hypothetical protein ID866_255 [Astraeus odoratus]|nr:hypothetical protein ID866_255 [Astraeus odoratus]
MMVFGLQKLLPGDPLIAMAGEERDPAVIAQLRAELNLDAPIPVQYFHWLTRALQGDLGVSLRTHEPVTELIASKLPVTLELSLLAMIIALVFGISMGILAAVNKNSWVDHGANFVAISGISIPHFWLGILLILVFSVNLQWLPASGYVPFSEDPLQNLRTLLLPASVLGTGLAATLMRHTRASMIAVLKADYIRTARAKGLLPKAVILKHAFRNALVPVITLTTLLFGELLGGAVLTEQVFTIPGFGKMIVDSVFNRDYAVVQGVVLIVAIGFLLLNLLADVLYVLINPKMRAPALPRAQNRVLKKFLANKSAVIGALVVGFFVLVALLAPWIAPFDPVKANFLAVRKAPSAMYWFGTDELGRDILSRIIWGARTSLMAGCMSVVIAVVIGVPLGLVAGYFQKMWDGVISRFIEALLACPFLIMAIALGAFLGPSLTNAMIAIGLSAMPIFARLTRGQVIAIRNEEYIDGARAIGLPDRWIIIKYVLPNVMSPILVQATLAIASAIIAEASLSFLGLGQQPPNPSWGSMLNTAKGFLEQAPWMSVFPGVAIFLAVQGFNLLGDGLRDALDPRHD